MKAVQPAVQGCIAIHFPSAYREELVKVAFVQKLDLNQLHAKGIMTGDKFEELMQNEEGDIVDADWDAWYII